MTYLTERQKQILEFIRSHKQRKGFAPTHKEICNEFGYSSYGTVYKHLSLLEQKGLIRRDANQKRGVELVDQSAAHDDQLRQLPLLGNIAAGLPLEVVPSEDTIAVPDHLTHRNDNYVLKVRGDSMIEDGIHDGDFVIIEPRQTASNGDMVVAMVAGEVTLKRFYREKGRIRLQPANHTMAPIYANPEDVHIQGGVVGLMRRF